MQNSKLIKTIIFIVLAIVLIVGGLFYFEVIKWEKGLTLEERKELSLEKTELAKEAMKEGDYENWENFSQEAIELDPDNILAYLLLGQAKYVQGKIEQARDVYLRGLEKDSQNFQMNFNLANVYRDLAEYEKSAEYYQKTLEINPDDSLVWHNLGFLYFVQEEPEKALEVYEEAMKKFPDETMFENMYQVIKETMR